MLKHKTWTYHWCYYPNFYIIRNRNMYIKTTCFYGEYVKCVLGLNHKSTISFWCIVFMQLFFLKFISNSFYFLRLWYQIKIKIFLIPPVNFTAEKCGLDEILWKYVSKLGLLAKLLQAKFFVHPNSLADFSEIWNLHWWSEFYSNEIELCLKNLNHAVDQHFLI